MIHYETTIYERKENIPIVSVYVTSNGTIYAIVGISSHSYTNGSPYVFS